MKADGPLSMWFLKGGCGGSWRIHTCHDVTMMEGFQPELYALRKQSCLPLGPTRSTKMTETMSIRMDRDNYEFLNEISKEERSDLSKVVRDLVSRGRIFLAVERNKKGEASLGRVAELVGLPVGQMMTILAELGVESRIEKEDYLQGLQNLAKVWQAPITLVSEL